MSLYIETSVDSLTKWGEELCGDKVEIVKNEEETILVLSDGLGSGVKANILASLTSKIIATMLADGAPLSDAVETIASTLPVCRERQIAYSTFSILRIKNNGETHLVEYDNPPAVILRRGKCLELEKTERAVGDKIIKEANFKLQAGDICVLFSDGAVHAGVGKLLNFGWQRKHIIDYLEDAYTPDLSASSLQNRLLSACDSLYMEMPGDDTTVAVCRVRLPSIGHVMVGPPLDPEDDEKVVRRLMETKGRKAVCGGTTSQIVSRALGRELKVPLRYISPDIPPVGQIEGVDLVTEGVLTLGKALDLIRRYEKGGMGRDNALLSGEDGASLLARFLIEDCTEIRFFVGRAINPAHQNPGLSISLNLKLRIVEDIAALLKRMEKKVSVEYY